MAQPQQRHPISSSRPRTTSRSASMSYDRTPGSASRSRSKSGTPQAAPQPTHRPRPGSSNQGSKRRSSSVQRYPSVQVQTNHPQHRHHHHNHLPPQYRLEGSDVGSVSSAPSVSKGFKEFREPSSSRSGGKKIYRDDSPANSKKSHPETPQKYTRTARKVVEGKFAGLKDYLLSCVDSCLNN